MSGYLPAIGAKEIEPLEMVDRVATAATETREGPAELRRRIWRDDSGAEIWLHYEGDAPHTTTVLFRGNDRISGHLTGFSPPVDGPMNGLVMVSGLEAPLPQRLVLDLAEYGEASAAICAGRRVSVGLAGLLTEGQVFRDRATYLAACSRRVTGEAKTTLQPVGLRPQGNSPAATLGGTIAQVEERRNSLTGETFLVLHVEWEGRGLEVAAHPADLAGEPPVAGAYLAARVWMAGFDLHYATAVPADPAQFPLAPGTAAAFTGWNGYLQLLQVTKVELLPPSGMVAHLRIFAELFDSLDALKTHAGARQIAVSHLPLDAAALLDSDIGPLGIAPLTEVDEVAYAAWRQAFDRGEAGVFAIPLDQVMSWMAQAQAQAQAGGEPASEEEMLSA